MLYLIRSENPTIGNTYGTVLYLSAMLPDLLSTCTVLCVNWHRFDVDLDLYPTFYFDADPDPDPIQIQIQILTYN
jgi:hypothetical protein